MSRRPPIDLERLRRDLHAHERSLPIRAARSAVLSSRPDATAVELPEELPYPPSRDWDLRHKGPQRPDPTVHEASSELGHDERPDAHILLHLF